MSTYTSLWQRHGLLETQLDPAADRHPDRDRHRRPRRGRAAVLSASSTIEKVEGVRPYTPLELAGRDIYVREGCYLCHSQMIRALRDEVERYGHYSLAAESMYDHPFQWGSKRNGPDLARVGGKYSDDWHRDHLRDPRSVVPGSIMPGYPWLFTTDSISRHVAEDLKMQALLGVPYTDEMIANALADLRTQATTDAPGAAALTQALSEGARARLRRPSGPYHRSRRADRLPADARHAGRLQALRRQSQHALRRELDVADLSNSSRTSRRPGASSTSSWSSSWCSPTRCGRRVSSSSMKRPACRCGRTEPMSDPTNTPTKTLSGIGTTGHEWDGIEELNTPLPRWWLWCSTLTIVWAIGYWVVYPAWPLFPSLQPRRVPAGIPAARWRPISPSCRRSVGR